MADLELTDKEKRVLAYTLLGEAAGEGREGMAAIMNVIMNRSNSGRYPSNPAAVAIQANKAGVHQFSTWNKKSKGGNDPTSRFSTNSQDYREALDIVQLAMSGQLEDNTGGATHFVSKKMFEDAKPYWWANEAPAGEVTIGGHVFGARNPNIGNVPNPAQGALAKGGKGAVASAVTGLKGTGPQSDITGQPRPLASRSVQTVPVDPLTGRPIPSYVTAAETAAERIRQKAAGDLVGEAARSSAVNAASSEKTDRAAAAQSADLVGAEATRPSLTGNLQSLGKEDRLRTTPRQDLVNEEARQTPGNAAAVNKTARARPAASSQQQFMTTAPQAKAGSVPATGKTVAQLQQEADNARRSGYREIQEMGPSTGAPKPVPVTPKPVTKFATPGVTRTTGPYQEPIPHDVRPQVIVKPQPKTEGPKPRSTVLPAEPKRLPANDALRLSTQVPSSQMKLDAGKTATATPSGGSRRGRAKAGDIASAKTAQLGANLNKPIVPSEAELSTVVRGDIRKGANALRVAPAVRQAAARKVEAWAPPRPAPAPAPARVVANAIAMGQPTTSGQPYSPSPVSNSWQESTFQWTENTGLPKSIQDDPRWW